MVFFLFLFFVLFLIFQDAMVAMCFSVHDFNNCGILSIRPLRLWYRLLLFESKKMLSTGNSIATRRAAWQSAKMRMMLCITGAAKITPIGSLVGATKVRNITVGWIQRGVRNYSH